MGKRDETIRVTIELEGEEREILVFWRKGNDYYSAVSGSKTHRSYHESGHTHTRCPEWGGIPQKSDHIKTTPSAELPHPHVIQSIAFIYDKEINASRLTFKPPREKNRKKDTFINIKITEDDDQKAFSYICGITPSKDSLEILLSEINSNNLIDILELKIYTRDSSPSMFVAVLSYEKDNSKIQKIIAKAIGIDKLQTLRLPNYIIINGKNEYLSLTHELLKPQKPFHEKPPELPIAITESMPKHSLKLATGLYDNYFVEAGPLSLLALPFDNYDTFQFILITLTENRLKGMTFTSVAEKSVMSPGEYKIIRLEFALYRGHHKKQFSINNKDYQIEIKAITTKKVDEEGNLSASGNFKTSYAIELIELSHLPA